MKDLSKMTKVKIPPIVILVSGLVIVGLLTALGGIINYNNELKNNSIAAVADTPDKPKDFTNNDKNTKNNVKTNQNSTNNSSDYAYVGNSLTTNSQVSNQTANSEHSATAQSNISYVNVFLSVNGNPKGNVKLKSGSNHCEVLSKAYSSGLISSLDMRYYPQYKTYGVYVIDGIGDASSVWWVYKVNGQSPPYGCSYTKVHGGDSVNWQYLKN